MSFKAECLAIAIHISDVGAAVKNQYVIKSPQLLRNYLKPMNLTGKRFWNWHTLIVVLIISLLIAIAVFFKRCMITNTADIERVGNEIIEMIDDFQKMNN